MALGWFCRGRKTRRRTIRKKSNQISRFEIVVVVVVVVAVVVVVVSLKLNQSFVLEVLYQQNK